MPITLPDDPPEELRLKPTKAIVGTIIAIVGTAVTTGLAFATPNEPVFVVLTILSAVLTHAGIALGVFFTPNRPQGGSGTTRVGKVTADTRDW